jgi:hypothetical protein
MCPIPHSGEGWRKNPVPGIRENIGDTTPAPAPVPRTMHQDKGAGLIVVYARAHRFLRKRAGFAA